MEKVEKRSEVRDPGEHEQNIAISKGLPALAPEPDQVAEVNPGKCQTCGRDITKNS